MIEFGEWSGFNKPIIGVTWPGSLEQLGFGRSFNQAIEGVTWPASLQVLTFGKRPSINPSEGRHMA